MAANGERRGESPDQHNSTANAGAGRDDGNKVQQPHQPEGSESGREGHESGGRGFLGKKPDAKGAAAALAKGQSAIAHAKKALANNREGDAMEAVGEAISALRPYASTSNECRAALKDANRIAKQIDAAIPSQRTTSGKRTLFE